MMIGFFNNKSTTAKNGKWKEFNKHAVLIAEGVFINNQKHGLWREYYDTGELMLEECFEYGIQHGRFASYHSNGKVWSEGNYVEGNREGQFRVYNENGRNIRNLMFVNNIKIEDVELEKKSVTVL
jgi:antitoxin component YwqK of YwqJK toxin-antitoxin module